MLSPRHCKTALVFSLALYMGMVVINNVVDPNPNYTAAEGLLAADMPIIPIYHYTSVRAVKPDIKGLSSTNVLNTWYAKDLYRIAQ